MKAMLLSILILSCALLGGQELFWGDVLGANGADNLLGMATDSEANVYVTGRQYLRFFFGADTLFSYGGADIVVAKLDRDGNHLWATHAGSATADIGFAIAADQSGNVYVAGEFTGTATFGNHSITSYGDTDVFVAKLNSAGDWLWVTGGGGTGIDCAQAIGIDNSGIISLAGYFTGPAVFADTLNGFGNKDIFLAHLDSNGNWLNDSQAGGTGEDNCTELVLDSDGNACVAGMFENTGQFGSISLTSEGQADFYVGKADPEADWVWVKAGAGTSGKSISGISNDAWGNCYITGSYDNSFIIDGTEVANNTIYSRLYVAKLTSFGTLVWIRTANGITSASSDAISSDAYGNCYVFGGVCPPAQFGDISLPSIGMQAQSFVAEIDLSGNWLWVRALPDYGTVYQVNVINNGDGTGFLGGDLTYQFTYHDITFTPYAQSDICLMGFGDPEPATPQNITIENLANDIHIHWDAVTTDDYGDLLIPDYYFIYYNYDQTPGGDYTFLDYTLAPIQYYVHQYAGLYSTEYFYNVTAVKNFGANISPRELDAYLDEHLHEGMTKAEVEAVLHNINLQ